MLKIAKKSLILLNKSSFEKCFAGFENCQKRHVSFAVEKLGEQVKIGGFGMYFSEKMRKTEV